MNAMELLEDLTVGYGEAVLAEVQATAVGLRVRQHDGFELQLNEEELGLCAGHLPLAALTKRVQLENSAPDFVTTLSWVLNGPWAAEDVDRLLGL